MGVEVFVFILIFLGVTVIGDRLDERFRVLYSDEMKCNHDKTLQLDVNDTQVYFYDFVNHVNLSSPIEKAAKHLSTLILEPERHLLVFTPGYKCFIQRDIEELIRQSFRNISNIYLVIIDHSAYTYEVEPKLRSYVRAVLYSNYIGRALGNFLAELNTTKKIHCVGHSLGSHIIGYAGTVFEKKTGRKIWRITALDPAGPCFSNSGVEDQVRSGSSEYTEVYHCNAGHLGTTSAIGDVDFFFNREGKIQPHCDEDLEDAELAKCYHKACIRYWTRTIQQPDLYLARACSSYQAFEKGFCLDNETTMAGYHNTGNATGLFYVSTV